jgi:hypothetical protein
VCGDPYQHVADTTLYSRMTGRPIQATYAAGSTISVEWHIQANHGGRIGFKLCPRNTNLDQACFDANPLQRCAHAATPRAQGGCGGPLGWCGARGARKHSGAGPFGRRCGRLWRAADARAQRVQSLAGASGRAASLPPHARRPLPRAACASLTPHPPPPAAPVTRRARADGRGLYYWILEGVGSGCGRAAVPLGTMRGSYRLPAGVTCSGGCVLQWVRAGRALRRAAGALARGLCARRVPDVLARATHGLAAPAQPARNPSRHRRAP